MAPSEGAAAQLPPYLNIDRENNPAVVAGRRSREAVAARDKDAWLANFAADGIVEDPVGPSMFDEAGVGHRGAQALSEFWDKTIGTTEKIDFVFDKEIICGDEVARGKPFPDIFLAAARRLNMDPGECVVLEDSESGLCAAQRA